MSGPVADAPALLDRLASTPPPALLATHVQPPLAEHAASGLDLILEGFLLHHGRSRVFDGTDPSPRVLAGDYCYAEGLVRVATSGDLFVIEALADLIALSASLVAMDRRDVLGSLWATTVETIARSDDRRQAAFLAAKDGFRAASDARGLLALGQEFALTGELELLMRQ